jgi:hypothetical protein
VSRRMLLLGLVAAAQLSTGCWCVRERIAWRWHNHHPVGCGPVCGPVCAPTPAFRIPSPPVVHGPVVGTPIGAPGCSTCASGLDGGIAYPVAGPGVVGVGAPPIIGPAMPLHTPRVEGPTPPPAGKN